MEGVEQEPSAEELARMPRELDEPDASVRPTSASEWSFEGPKLVTLPSGNNVMLRPPDLLELLRQGDIPNPLMEYVQRLFADEDVAEIEAEAAERDVPVEQVVAERAEREGSKDAERDIEREQEAPEWIDFMHLLVWASMAEPEVSFEDPLPGTATAADGKLSIRALSEPDKMFVFEWASRRVASFSTFPRLGAGADRNGDRGEVREAS